MAPRKAVKKAAVKRTVAKKRAPAKRAVVKKSTRKVAPSKATAKPRATITDDVTAAVVDEVPPSGNARGRTMRYANVLAEVRAKVGKGKPVIIATYTSRQSATFAKKAMENGERPVDGKVSDWRFTARRTGDGGSVLYAELVK